MSEIGYSGQQFAPAPGWYPDGSGALRWWDGQSWGPLAPPASTADTWRTVAVLCHLTLFALPVMLPIILRVMAGQQGRLPKHHTNEALNAQIWFVIVWNLSIGSITMCENFGVILPSWSYWILAIAPVALLFTVICAICGAISAYRGNYWRYPMLFRFTRGSVRGPAPSEQVVAK